MPKNIIGLFATYFSRSWLREKIRVISFLCQVHRYPPSPHTFQMQEGRIEQDTLMVFIMGGISMETTAMR